MPLDLLFEIDDYPPAGEKRDARRLTIQGGGPVPNAMVGLRRLGCSVAVISGVADDVIGRLGAEELANEKIGTRYLVWKRNGRSDTAGGFVEGDSGRRTIVLSRGLRLTARDVTISSLPTPKLIHLDGRDVDACIKLAKWGHRVGAEVCFDIGSVRNDVSSLLPLVDHLVIADAFAFPFTGTRTARGAVLELCKLCPGTVVVSEGIKGSTGFENGEWVRQRAYRVKAVDATGAGDAFHVGYLYGLLHGYTLAHRLDFGSAVAALKCTRPGARSGMPTMKQVREFLQRKPRQYA